MRFGMVRTRPVLPGCVKLLSSSEQNVLNSSLSHAQTDPLRAQVSRLKLGSGRAYTVFGECSLWASSPRVLSNLKGQYSPKSNVYLYWSVTQMIEFHTIIEHNYSSVDFIYIFLYVGGHFEKEKVILKTYRTVFLKKWQNKLSGHCVECLVCHRFSKKRSYMFFKMAATIMQILI